MLHVGDEAALLDCEALGTADARCTLRAPWSPAFEGRSFAPPREVTSRERMLAVEHDGVVHVVVFDEAFTTGYLVHSGATGSELVAWTPPSTDVTFDAFSLERVEGGVRLVLRGRRTRALVLDDHGRITQPLTELPDASAIDPYAEARRALPSLGAGFAAIDLSPGGGAAAWESVEAEPAALRFAWLDCRRM